MQCRIVSNAIVVNLNCSWIFKLQKWENVHVNWCSLHLPAYGHIHMYTFWNFSVRFRISSTLKRLFSIFKSLCFHRKRRLSKTGSKVETFENGDFRKRCVVVWMGKNRDFWKWCWFENACTCGRGLYIIVPHYIAYVQETEICDGSNYTIQLSGL